MRKQKPAGESNNSEETRTQNGEQQGEQDGSNEQVIVIANPENSSRSNGSQNGGSANGTGGSAGGAASGQRTENAKCGYCYQELDKNGQAATVKCQGLGCDVVFHTNCAEDCIARAGLHAQPIWCAQHVREVTSAPYRTRNENTEQGRQPNFITCALESCNNLIQDHNGERQMYGEGYCSNECWATEIAQQSDELEGIQRNRAGLPNHDAGNNGAHGDNEHNGSNNEHRERQDMQDKLCSATRAEPEANKIANEAKLSNALLTSQMREMLAENKRLQSHVQRVNDRTYPRTLKRITITKQYSVSQERSSTSTMGSSN